MIAASYISMKLRLLDEESVKRIRGLISRTGLKTLEPALDTQQVLAATQSDKKISDGRVRFILLDRIGHAVVRDDVPESLAREAIEYIRS